MEIARITNIRHFGEGIEFEGVHNKGCITNNNQQSLFQRRELQGIEWSNVNYSVGKKTILHDCWGSVPAGEMCALLRPSGCGKVFPLAICFPGFSFFYSHL